MATIEWHQNAELPALTIWWRDNAGALLDMSDADGFTLRIGRPGHAAVLEKTLGITGAVGAGVAPSGTPNVTVDWLPGELDIAAGTHRAQLTAHFATDYDRVIEFAFRVLAAIDEPA